MKKTIYLVIAGVVGLSSNLFALDLKKCAGCHGKSFEKKALGKPVKFESEESVYKTLAGYKNGTENKFGMGMIMKGQVSSYSDEELKELSKMIMDLRKK